MSSSSDLGVELWTLVYHLYAVYRSPHEAFRELALRTGTTYLDMTESATPPTPHELIHTPWYHAMREAYVQTRHYVRDTHANTIEDARVLVRDLYPHGCSLSDYADAVQTCVAMFTVTVPATLTRRYIDEMSDVLGSGGKHHLSLDELTRGVVDDLLVTSLLPARWWSSTTRTAATTAAASGHARHTMPSSRATRVCARRQPLELVIEYDLIAPQADSKECTTSHSHTSDDDDDQGDTGVRRGGRMRDGPTDATRRAQPRSSQRRHRVIALDGLLSTHTSAAALARRLAASHEVLVNESTLQRVLVHLQQRLSTLPSREMTPLLTPPRTRMRGAETREERAGAEGCVDSVDPGPSFSTPAAWPAASVDMRAVEAAAATQVKDEDEAQKADVGLLYRDPEAAMHNVDLNDADEVTLKEFKDAMNSTFQAHVVRPGDAGYVYDKRVEVAKATQRSEWDDDD